MTVGSPNLAVPQTVGVPHTPRRLRFLYRHDSGGTAPQELP